MPHIVQEEKTMLQLCEELEGLCHDMRYKRDAGELKQYGARIKGGLQKLRKVANTESELGATLNLLLPKIRQQLAKLISDEAGWTNRHQDAAEIINRLREYSTHQIDLGNLNFISQDIARLKDILKSKLDLSTAEQALIRYVQKLAEAARRLE